MDVFIVFLEVQIISGYFSSRVWQQFRNENSLLRGGCLTGSSHKGAELHGFLSYLVKTVLNNKFYKVFGHKGKQVRDNLHSSDLVNAFWEFYKKPKKGAVYNIGGSRISNCSILTIELIERLLKLKQS